VSISVAVLTYNEASRLPACLESAAWCDELIVVDGFSTDDSVAIAQQFTNKVYVSDRLGPKNPGGFSDQRNYALELATSEWVFFLDADERFTPELVREIQSTCERDISEDVGAFRVRRREHFFGIYTPYTHGESWLVRMLRRKNSHWNGRLVHEGVSFEGQLESFVEPILHYSKDSIADYVATQNRYTTLEAQQAALDNLHLPGSPLFGMLRTFLNIYIYKGGYREGAFGLIMSLLFAQYFFLCWAKRWEIAVKAERLPSSAPRNVNFERGCALLSWLWNKISPAKS
jgi:glycosyltransferase involved in cell wall biosynthesis